MIGFNTLTKMLRLSRGGAMTAQCPGDNGTQFQSPAARKPSLSDCLRQCEVIMASARSHTTGGASRVPSRGCAYIFLTSRLEMGRIWT